METEKKSHGALIGSIIIIVILIIGGIYVWQARNKDVEMLKQQQQLQTEAANALTASELSGLEEDINNTDTSTNVDVNTIQ